MRLYISVLATLSFGALAFASPTVIELNTNMTRFQVNAATNAELPMLSNPFQSDSLAISPSNQLFSADATGVLWDVTGAPIPAGPTLRTQIADLDYGVGGLWGFSNASQELFFFDLGLSTVTYSQVITGTSGLTITGVAFQPSSGDVYLSGYSGLNADSLLVVPNASSSASLVGAMANGDGFSYFSDIDFDASGTLYAMSFFHRWFYTVSLTNGSTTFVSAGPHRDTTAMAINAVPEPGTMVALAMGAAAVCRRRRR